MESENIPSLPDAHQQVRLGDNQASLQKWTTAIEHYSHAIKYFKIIQKSLCDTNLISILQAQILQCEKSIHICCLKDRFEQAIKDQASSKIARAHSISSGKPTKEGNRSTGRYTKVHLKNTSGSDVHDGKDSLAALMFPHRHRNVKENPLPVMIKRAKDDSEKMEELKLSYEATKNALKAALDQIETLKDANFALRQQKHMENIQQHSNIQLLSTNQEEDEQNESENELEATI